MKSAGDLRATEDALLLAATAASLARRGWPAAKTAALLAESLPEGAPRTRLAAAAAALERGDAPGTSFTGDPLAALLARGETAGPDALAAIAHAHTLELRARRMAAASLAYPATTAAVAALMIGLGGRVQRTLSGFYTDWSVPPSGLGAMALAILPWVEIAGWILLVCAIAALVAMAFGAGFLPGVRSLRIASLLRQIDAALASGVAEPAAFSMVWPGARGFDSLPLRERERCLAQRLATRMGAGPAARALALELERDAREANRLAFLLFPFVGLFALLLLFGLTGLAILGPILSIY